MEKTRITSITLQNFGPFYKVHEVKFLNDGHGIHIIRGNTGQGKTSLQRAILWCLYGKVFDRNNKQIPFTSLLNRSAQKENDFFFAVKISFNHNGDDWVLTRKTKALYHNNRKYEAGMELYLIKKLETKKKPQKQIEKILPIIVSRFFFFDGEMLVKYEELLDQDSRSMKILKNSIEHILGIPYLRTARDDLSAIKSCLDREVTQILKRMGGKTYTELANDHECILEEIEYKKSQIKSLETQKDALGDFIADLKRRQTEIQSIKELALERQKIDNEIKTLQIDQDSYKSKLREYNSELYKSLLVPIAKSIIDQLKLKNEKIMNKYNQKQQLLRDKKILDQGIEDQICKVCGTVLNPVKLKEFQKQLTEIKVKIESLTEIPEPNMSYGHSAEYLERMSKKLVNPEEYVRLEGQINKIQYQIASKDSRLSQISEHLTDVDEQEPFELENEIIKSTKELGRMEGEQKTLKDQLEEDYETKRFIHQQLARIDREELNTINLINSCVASIKEVFDDSISIYRDERRIEVESKSTEIFKEIRSKEDFEKLEINSNFGLSIITTDGTILNKAEWRSAGEEQIVALSLIGALNKCARVEAPVFMDTALSRLDIKHGQRVLSYVPKMSDQVVMLVTDREFRKEDEEYLSGKIMSDFTLIHEGERKGSKIIETNCVGEC